STPVGRISTLAALNTLTLVADTADTASQEALLETRRAAAAQLVCEIERQFRADGGHVSRNPAMTLHALVELIPLLRTYSYLAVAEPDALHDWRQRMQKFLRTLRLCDRGLAAFHGGDTIRAQRLATVLKLDPTLEARSTLGESGYERIEAGALQLICDVGSATHADAHATSHASFGAFVLGDGPHPIFVNCGAPVASSVPDAHQAHRHTAHHTALSFPNLPNARLDACRLSETAGANYTVAESAETLSLDMSHRGYAEAFGLAHTRSIVVDRTGNRVSGTDQLRSAGPLIRLKRDEPFAIHFHVADDVEVQLAPAANCVVLHLAMGGAWDFAATGAQLYVETSPRFGRRAKPGRQAQQLVLRAATCGESTVSWTLSRRFA
ncbi:MAG: heparinase II/III family protein, partial [Pseudomonadota bacterium]